MQAVYTSGLLAILCTSCVIGPKPKVRNSKAKVEPSFFEGTQCGISKSAPNSARIIGGEEATPHSWPWMVLIFCTHFNVAKQEDIAEKCGGSVISENWVVTAAHCLGPPVLDAIRDCELAFGKHDFEQIEPTQVMRNTIAQYFIHPQFEPVKLQHDLALIKLTNPLKFSSAIQPICLPFGPEQRPSFKLAELPYNKTCYTTGWGSTVYGSEDWSYKLRQLSMMVADERYCGEQLGHNICAVTWDANKNACDGDSGGPLACQEQDGKWYLRGVLSYGEKNCKFWTVFIKVAWHKNWINWKIAEN